MDSKLINTNMPITYEIIQDNNTKDIKIDFDSFEEHKQDSIGGWAKIATAKSNDENMDSSTFKLLVEIYRKMEKIENLLENKRSEHIKLLNDAKITHIGHSYIVIDNLKIEENNQNDTKYYGRMEIPVFPKRLVPLYFSHTKDNIFKINLMHQRDIADYDAFINATERTMIREIKNKND